MTSSPNTLYLPYGAYELKARYQFNLMFATLLTVSMVGLLLLSFWIHSLFAVEPYVPPPKDPVIVQPWDIPPPPLVIPETPDINFEQTITATPEYFIPTPVDDDEVIDENIILATIQDRKQIVQQGAIDIVGTGGGIVIDPTAITEYIPPVDSFIHMEIRPEMIDYHLPEYPRLIRDAGIEGVVWVAVWLSEEGKVLKAVVHKSSGTKGLDEAAVEAAYKNVFKPGIQNNTPVKCWASYKVVFELAR